MWYENVKIHINAIRWVLQFTKSVISILLLTNRAEALTI
jgi:hypothetical protein